MVKDELQSKVHLKMRLAFEGVAVGAVVGSVIVLFRLTLQYILQFNELILRNLKWSSPTFFLVILGLGIFALLSSLLLRWEPLITGSGIPQVQGELQGAIDHNPLRVLIGKLLSGLLSLGAGLTLGREGPSVQIGAACAKLLGQIFRRPKSEYSYLLSAGAAAGLGSAFHAPLAGVVFSLEEAHRNFSSVVFLSAMSASMVADYISKNVFGLEPILQFNIASDFPILRYWLILPIGLVLGFSGWIFNKGLLWSKKVYDKLKFPLEAKIFLAFLLSFFFMFFLPDLFGSGHDLIFLGLEKNPTTSYLFLLLVGKFMLLFIAFGSSLSGGIFFPLLVIGSLVGQVMAFTFLQLGIISAGEVIFFIILSMTAHFSAIVRSPLTGILLIAEMTGFSANFLPLATVAFIAYLTSDLLHNEPIYESLLHALLLDKKKKKDESHVLEQEQKNQQILWECAVHANSKISGKCIKEVVWPHNILLVSIQRGNEEILPKGDTVILGGDYITLLCKKQNMKEICSCMNDLCAD